MQRWYEGVLSTSVMQVYLKKISRMSVMCVTQVYHTGVSFGCATQVCHASVAHRCVMQLSHTGVASICATQLCCRNIESKLVYIIGSGKTAPPLSIPKEVLPPVKFSNGKFSLERITLRKPESLMRFYDNVN